MDGELPFSMLDVIALLNLPYPPSGRASYNINCPCCDTHNKKHLNINLVKNAFCCPKCGFSGGMLDLYGFYAKMDRSKAYRAILEKLQLDSQTVKIERARKKQQAAVNEYPLTGIEERDATYRAFLNRLSLASDHRANLMERGLNDEVIQQNLYRTTPAGGYEAIAKQLLLEGHYLAGVPGFYRKEGVWTYCGTRRGILLPVRDYFGRIQGIKVRLDNVARRKFRWLSTAEMPDGCKAEAWAHVAGDAQDTILLIEGPLKADIVHYLTGMTLVAVSGVGSLTHLQQTLTVMQEQGVRKVMTAFDMDMMTNCHVQKDFRRLTAMLQEMGFQFGTYLWDPRCKGLDDYVWARKNKKTI
jgi:DNA primase